jgi:S-adenosylmethionine-diacylglycerol 3-amino-3-carboxypropyl transferase
VALDIQPHHNVMVITSAGCNALDYALAGANHVYAVDMNPRQNALLDLKKAAISNLEYEDFFAMFGRGQLGDYKEVYSSKLRAALPEWSRSYWDRKIKYFRPRRRRSRGHNDSGECRCRRPEKRSRYLATGGIRPL